LMIKVLLEPRPIFLRVFLNITSIYSLKRSSRMGLRGSVFGFREPFCQWEYILAQSNCFKHYLISNCVIARVRHSWTGLVIWKELFD
jgi:hypothetical protein